MQKLPQEVLADEKSNESNFYSLFFVVMGVFITAKLLKLLLLITLL